jgi:hypothetical protein
MRALLLSAGVTYAVIFYEVIKYLVSSSQKWSQKESQHLTLRKVREK